MIGYREDGLFCVGPLAFDAQRVPGHIEWGFGIHCRIWRNREVLRASVDIGLGPWGTLYTMIWPHIAAPA